jgi:hypothetical protein
MRYDADLSQLPLLLEADCLSGLIQTERLNHPRHFGEAEASAIIKILTDSGAECSRH